MEMLAGKSIVVTGASGGIGSATCHVLAAAGAQVVATDLHLEGGQRVVDEIRAQGGKAIFVQADLGSEVEVQAMIDAAVSAFGRLDGAFNNAGLEQCATPLHKLSTEQWNRAMLIDLTSVFWCIKYEVIAMLRTGAGAIVNTASSLGQVAIPNAAEYVSAKHGVMGLTRAAAADYGALGIRVNAVMPGIVLTPMVARIRENPTFAAFFEQLLARHPIGRFGQPSEIGESVKWLLSDGASNVNGACIPVDGGYLAI